jgi:hypothetical protein
MGSESSLLGGLQDLFEEVVEIGRCVLTSECAPKGVEVRVHVPFQVEILEITWKSGIEAVWDKSKIPAPHWEKGGSFNEGDDPKLLRYPKGSTRPGVYLLKGKGSNKLSVKVKVTNRDNLSGKFLLRGTLGGTGLLVMQGPCPLRGEHEVELNITNLPDSMQHYTGDSKWDVVEMGGKQRKFPICERPRLEAFVVYDKPTDLYTGGVWIEALRLMFNVAGVTGFRKADSISKHVTKYCHTKHEMRYETKRGKSGFGVNGRGGAFNLMDYIKKVDNVVNCYDQAAAVQSLCGCLGVKVGWVFQYPFGYINTTNLVGVGPCNNPFYKGTDATGHPYANKPVVNPGDKNRSAFGNHAFVETVSGYIRDACAGPHIEKEILRSYFKAAIDLDTTLLDRRFSDEINPLRGISRDSLLDEWETRTEWETKTRRWLGVSSVT